MVRGFKCDKSNVLCLKGQIIMENINGTDTHWMVLKGIEKYWLVQYLSHACALKTSKMGQISYY